MATFRQTMKDCLLGYPSIFPNPTDVCAHLFAVNGNGYEWIDGELVDPYGEEKNLTRMKYPFREEREFEKKFWWVRVIAWFKRSEHESKFLRDRKLKDNARKAQMRWVEKNIDAIVDASPVNTYFGSERGGSYVTDHICPEYADGLDFPEDIQRDWAEALYEFLNYWIRQLHQQYSGLPETWPVEIVEARKAIFDARSRLHVILYNETYEEHAARISQLFKGIFSDEK